MPFGRRRPDIVAPVPRQEAPMAGSDNLASRLEYGRMHIDAALAALKGRELVGAVAVGDALLDLRTLLTDGTPPRPIEF